MNLTDISCIGESALELLEATGFHRVDSLAYADPESLYQELERANSVLRISPRNFSLSEITEWIQQARERVNKATAKEDQSQVQVSVSLESMPVNYELLSEVVAMLDSAPMALPLPTSILIDQNLPVSKIPIGILLNSYVGDLEVRVNQRTPGKSRSRAAAAGAKMEGPAGSLKSDLDLEKIRNAIPREEGYRKLPSGMVSPDDEQSGLLRAPRVSTNKGVNPDSRWYIRGVLHTHPVSLYVGALATIGIFLSIVTSLISATLLIFSSEVLGGLNWVPRWLLVFPMTLPLFGIVYLIWGLAGKCRICHQKLFTHQSHLKNTKAHYVNGLGYILPLCFQMIIFRWFRCSHCGTSVRLKK